MTYIIPKKDKKIIAIISAISAYINPKIPIYSAQSKRPNSKMSNWKKAGLVVAINQQPEKGLVKLASH